MNANVANLSVAVATHAMAARYAKIVDWERFFQVVRDLGKQCDSRKMRFDKASIFEQAISICSQGRLIWFDEIGRDLHDVDLELDLEFKYVENLIFTPKKKDPKKLVTVKIKNSLGKTRTADIRDPADYYILAQQDAVGIISYREMRPYLKVVGDGLRAEIPYASVTLIVTPPSKQKEQKKNPKVMNYEQSKLELQRRFIQSIPPSPAFAAV